MALYSTIETGTAYKYLQQLVKILDEPICILGGWAVYLTVNNNFKKEEGRNYLGSKDIDLGFHIDPLLDKSELKHTVLAKSLEKIEKDGFNLQSFRYYKEIHYETGKELTQEEIKVTPSHNIFTMYIDPIVDTVHPAFKEIFGFTPADESLLLPVFKDSVYRNELREFNKKLWLPTSEILLATKMKSLPTRPEGDKFIKDICDIYALSWYSGINYKTLKEKSRQHIDNEIINKIQTRMSKEKDIFQKTQNAMDIDAETIQTLLIDLLDLKL
jgi:hypothetical protein